MVEYQRAQFRPALALLILWERSARELGEANELAAALVGRGSALEALGRPEEAMTAYMEAVPSGSAELGFVASQRHASRLRLFDIWISRPCAFWRSAVVPNSLFPSG